MVMLLCCAVQFCLSAVHFLRLTPFQRKASLPYGVGVYLLLFLARGEDRCSCVVFQYALSDKCETGFTEDSNYVLTASNVEAKTSEKQMCQCKSCLVNHENETLSLLEKEQLEGAGMCFSDFLPSSFAVGLSVNSR